MNNVLPDWDSRPVSGEDSSPVGVLLALEDDAVSRSLESEVESSDAGEQGSDIHAAGLSRAIDRGPSSRICVKRFDASM